MMESSKLRDAEPPKGVAGKPPVARVPLERKEPIMITTLCAVALLAVAVFVLAGCIATVAL